MGETLMDDALVGDSRMVVQRERAVQTLEKQVRAMKLSTESSLGRMKSVKHPAYSWLVMHAPDVITRCQIKSDRRTAYEKIKVATTLVMIERGMSIPICKGGIWKRDGGEESGWESASEPKKM